MVAPSIRPERALMRAGAHRVCGMDEVGRGAIAGPVTVGVAVVDRLTRTAPKGLRDSKLMTAAARRAIVPKLREWCVESAVGYGSAAEIDEFGLMAALRFAGMRALNGVGGVDHVILDGSFNWLTQPEPRSLPPESPQLSHRRDGGSVFESQPAPSVSTVIQGDRLCSSVAAASVIAKVDRDARMHVLHDVFPDYRWDLNKGYSTPQHMEAIREHGQCCEHRHSWNLPTSGNRPESSLG